MVSEVNPKSFVVMQPQQCSRCLAYNREHSECRLIPPVPVWSDIQEDIFFAHPVVPDDHYCMQFHEMPND